MSLSSRRAWIEICENAALEVMRTGRSPHGERGLKYKFGELDDEAKEVALLTESVD